MHLICCNHFVQKLFITIPFCKMMLKENVRAINLVFQLRMRHLFKQWLEIELKRLQNMEWNNKLTNFVAQISHASGSKAFQGPDEPVVSSSDVEAGEGSRFGAPWLPDPWASCRGWAPSRSRTNRFHSSSDILLAHTGTEDSGRLKNKQPVLQQNKALKT